MIGKERAKELDRELEEAIEGEQVQLSLNIVQARMLLCIHRSGMTALAGLQGKTETVARESLMFNLIDSTYRSQSNRLGTALERFEHIVEERVTELTDGLVYKQLAEILGRDIADALINGDDKTPRDPGSV